MCVLYLWYGPTSLTNKNTSFYLIISFLFHSLFSFNGIFLKSKNKQIEQPCSILHHKSSENIFFFFHRRLRPWQTQTAHHFGLHTVVSFCLLLKQNFIRWLLSFFFIFLFSLSDDGCRSYRMSKRLDTAYPSCPIITHIHTPFLYITICWKGIHRSTRRRMHDRAQLPKK